MTDETKNTPVLIHARALSPEIFRRKKRINRSEEGKRAKKESDRIRAKSRVNIGGALPRWKALKDEKGLRRDADVAQFLLDCIDGKAVEEGYEDGPLVLLQRGETPAALSSINTESERDDDVSSGICALEENQEEADVQQRVQQLRASVKQRLTAAVEEIFGLFERTIAEYEEEIDRQRRLLEDVLKPEIQINKADVPQLLVSEEEVPPEQQDWSPSLDQEDPEPPHIKEEQEELWTSQEGEQLQGPEEADITEFPFTPVPVKSEDDEEKPQSSQLHQSQSEENREAEPLASSSAEQMKTEADGEDCGVSEPARNLDPASHLQATSDGKTSDSSEPETEDSDDYGKETREPQSGLDSLKNNEVLISHKRSYTGEKLFSCSDCGKRFDRKGSLQRHMRVHTGEKLFSCSICGKRFDRKGHLQTHMRVHTGEKPFSCSVCGQIFSQSGALNLHMRIHTGEKPFSCSDCAKGFGDRGNLEKHMRVHTGEKPFSCSVCGKMFSQSGTLRSHMRIHTGEKPFSCSYCAKSFGDKGNLKKHMRVHTGEKPFSCSDCAKSFGDKGNLNQHMRVHTGKKLFSCSDCGKGFGRKGDLKKHMRVHTEEKSFSCSVCGKSFVRKGNLNTHMRIHTEEKPFSCSVCEKQFNHQVKLVLHMRVHTGQKPYSFGQHTHVKKHKCSGESSSR